MKKKILFITTSRADFDLQKDLIINLSKKYDCYLICTGTHFDTNYGYSYKNILKTNIKKIIIYKIKDIYKKTFDKIHSEYLSIVYSCLKKINPNLICLFGDRSEILITSFVAYSLKVPIAHFSGGELTEGSLDDSYRHCITKFSNFHFTTSKEHKKRVIQLGENKKNVFNFGSLIISNIKNKKFFLKEDLEKIYLIKFKKFNFLLTLHPDKENLYKNYKKVFQTLEHVKDSSIFISRPNNDNGSKQINQLIKSYLKKNKNFYLLKEKGSHLYFSLIKKCNCVIGNSSSGISEVPSLKIPTINIGYRQFGRPRSISIIDVDYNKSQILNAVKISLTNNFLRKIKKNKNPFFKKNSLRKTIVKVEKLIKIKLTPKKFFDLNFNS